MVAVRMIVEIWTDTEDHSDEVLVETRNILEIRRESILVKKWQRIWLNYVCS
jgi:hypothetical protein